MSTCSVVYLSGMTLRTAALVRTARAPSRRVVRGMATAPPPCISASAADTIGNTPLVDCSRLVQQSGLTGRILAKLEFCNPGFSKKDRIAKQIIDDALMGGAVRPGDTVVELTSGNTGTGLAIVCAARGLRFVAVMSEGNSVERAHMMRALGAEVILVPQCRGSTLGQVSGADLALVDEVCRSVVQDRGAFRADQFDLEGSVSAHYNHTGPEFWAQSGGSIDAFVDFVGSGGTFAGCSKYLKQASGGHVACYIVEPENAAVLAAEAAGGVGLDNTGTHPIQGGGYSKNSTELKFIAQYHDLVDGYLQVSDAEAIETARRLAVEEGIFGGPSGGANVAAALQLLRREEWSGATIAAVICDSGLKYLSTDLWHSEGAVV